MFNDLETLINTLSDEEIRKRLERVTLREISFALSTTSNTTKNRVIHIYSKILGKKVMTVMCTTIEGTQGDDEERSRSVQKVFNALGGKTFIDWRKD